MLVVAMELSAGLTSHLHPQFSLPVNGSIPPPAPAPPPPILVCWDEYDGL